MYDPVALDLSYVNRTLPRHYDSDEEDISESEGHASPLDAHKRSATLDSIMSVSDGGYEHDEQQEQQNDGREQEQPFPESGAGRPAFSRLLSLPSDRKTSRPGSIDTVKRSSSATFVTEPCTIFDHDDDDEIIIELPSPDSTTPLQSPILLQPSVYVPSEPLTSSRNSFNSASSASVYSDDESDIFVAEQVTYVEHAKPNLILISPTESCPSSSLSPRDGNLPSSPSSASSGSVYSNDEASRSQPVLGEPWPYRGRDRSPYPSRPLHSKTPGSLSALDTLKNCGPRHAGNEPMSAPAAEAPRPLSFRARSMSFSRPQTPAAETRRRLQKEPSRRPPSAQSTATFSLFPAQSQSRTSTPIPAHGNGHEDSCASSTYSLSLSSQPPSRTASPSPYSCGSPAYNRSRSGSLYSVSSTSAAHSQATGKRPPLPYRGSISMVKSRSSTMPMGGYSSSSLRAELNPQPEEQKASSKSKSKTHSSKKSLKQSKDKESETPSSAKSFVGFMLRGKRKSVIKN
ncbi:hypothetical protein BDW72DRAFT_209936 [Aspergillus terricola var. indicus]